MTSAGQGTDKTMTENGYLEGPTKAIFEWLFFYATLYNKERMALEIANESEERYDCTAQNAYYNFQNDVDAAKPTAIWAYYSNYPGYEGWQSATCDPSYNYYCEYSDACNINLLHTSEPMNDTQFEAFAKKADLFFYSSNDWDNVYDSKKEMLDGLKSVMDRHVYDRERSGENTWWEQRMAEYGKHSDCAKFCDLIVILLDIVLEDFCTVANMTTDLNFHERHYLRNVFYEQVGEMEVPKSCGDGVPLDSRATECTLLMKPSTVNISDNDDVPTSSDGAIWNVGKCFQLSFIVLFLLFL